MTTPGPDERLSAYYDGELSAAERAEVERLLTEREDLRNELGGLADLSHRLQELADDQPEFDLRHQVLRQIENTRRPLLPLAAKPIPLGRQTWMPLLLTACSLMLLTAVMLPLITPSQNSPQIAKSEAAGTPPIESTPAIMLNTAGEQVHFSEQKTTDPVAQDGAGPSVLLAQIEQTRGLKPGEIISRMVDSGDTPMLAEYTVIDVRRSAHDVEVLLQRHGIQPLLPKQEKQGVSTPAENNSEEMLKVYLVDAESHSLNTAFQEFGGLTQVVSANLEPLPVTSRFGLAAAEPSRSAEAEASLPTSPPLPSRDRKAITTTPESKDSLMTDDMPSSKKLDLSLESRGSRGEAISNPGVASSATKLKMGSVSAPAKAGIATSAVVLGNAVAVENGEAVYAELQYMLKQPPQAAGDRRLIVKDRAPPASNAPQSQLDSLSIPNAKANDVYWGSHSPPSQQSARNRQRAFLVLRSTSSQNLPAQSSQPQPMPESQPPPPPTQE